MRLIAYSLQQLQRPAVEAKPQRLTLAGLVDFLELLGQADDRQLTQAKLVQLATCHPKLSLASVDQDEIRHRALLPLESAVPPPHRLRHAGKVVLRHNTLHAKPPVLCPIRPSIEETDHRRHHECAADVRYVEALDPLGWLRQAKRLAKRCKVAFEVYRPRQFHRHTGEFS